MPIVLREVFIYHCDTYQSLYELSNNYMSFVTSPHFLHSLVCLIHHILGDNEICQDDCGFVIFPL